MAIHVPQIRGTFDLALDLVSLLGFSGYGCAICSWSAVLGFDLRVLRGSHDGSHLGSV